MVLKFSKESKLGIKKSQVVRNVHCKYGAPRGLVHIAVMLYYFLYTVHLKY